MNQRALVQIVPGGNLGFAMGNKAVPLPTALPPDASALSGTTTFMAFSVAVPP
jgi:hypothetical protein